jgi:tetratricopeptide (TPR) repeat protein
LAKARENLANSRKEGIKEQEKKAEIDKAISLLKEALKLNPNFSPAKSGLIGIYFNSENPDLELEYFSEKEYFYLNRARNYWLKANAENVSEEDKKVCQEKTISDYLEALKINANLSPAKTELAQIYFNDGKEKEAFELVKYKEYLYLNRARNHLRKINDKTTPEDKRKFQDSALPDLLEAHKLNSKLQPVRVELAQIYIQKGFEFSEKKEFANAITEFTKAIEMVPERAVYHDYRGDAYYANQEIDKAIDDYETFLDLEQSDHKRMNEEAWKFLTAEEGKQVSKAELKLALEFSQKSLKLSPDNPHYLDTLAEVYLKLGDKSKAKKANDQAKKIAEEKNDTKLLKVILEREGRF